MDSLTPTSHTVVGAAGRNNRNSHNVEFFHPLVGYLTVYTGIDNVSWGYGLNTQRYPTYGGEVVQILSAYVDDLEVGGTMRSLRDMEDLHTYFFMYMHGAASAGERNETPMTFSYPQRQWTFDIIPTSVPSYRKATEQTVPEWKVQAHVVDHRGDVEELKQLITEESQLQGAYGESFGLEGTIRYVDENPFSDPWTDHETKYDPTDDLNKNTEFFSKLIPSYLDGDFDTVFGGLGAKPAFAPQSGTPKGSLDEDTYNRLQATERAQLSKEQKQILEGKRPGNSPQG